MRETRERERERKRKNGLLKYWYVYLSALIEGLGHAYFSVMEARYGLKILTKRD